jgi:GNAT superfamily N-acetyltransferase
MNNCKSIKIRQFQEADLEQVSDIIVQAFIKKFTKICSLEKYELPNFLIDLGVIPSCPYPGYFVAEKENKILAVLMLKWRKQNIPKMKKNYLLLISKYGWKNLIDTSIGLYILDIKPKKGVCFFKSMAVLPEMQGTGIAAKLAKYGIEYSKNRGFKKIILRIAASNKKAINHIERVGFKIKKQEKSYYTKFFFGIEKWYYYELIL